MLEGKGVAEPRTEVYGDEIMEAAAGLDAAIKSPVAKLASGITVWLVNHAAASRLADGHIVTTRPNESIRFA